jgi:hypothetical protein
MDYQLGFSARARIIEDEIGLRVPITLASHIHEIEIEAYFDSGAKYCVFPRWLGEDLGLSVESGHPVGLHVRVAV